MKKILGLALALAPGWLLIHAWGSPPPAALAPEGVPPPPPVTFTISRVGEPSLEEIVLRLAELSGITVDLGEGVKARLAAMPLPFEGVLEVRPRAAWPVVETLLLEADCLLVETGGSFSVQDFRRDPPEGFEPRVVRLAELSGEIAEHPALFVELHLELTPLRRLRREQKIGFHFLGTHEAARRVSFEEPDDAPPRVRLRGGASWVADRAALLVDLGATEIIEAKEDR